MEELPKKKGNLAVGVIFVFFSIAIISLFLTHYRTPMVNLINRLIHQKESVSLKETGFQKFTSAEEFNQYLSQAQELQGQGFGFLTTGAQQAVSEMKNSEGMGMSPSIDMGGGYAERVSDTNVQVKGIDEPDILKTNGKQIFAFTNGFYRDQPAVMETPPMDPMRDDVIYKAAPGVAPRPFSSGTLIIDAFPPQNLAKLAEINESSELLLSDKTLIIINQQKIVGYNVSDPQVPKLSWTIDFESRSRYLSARLMDNQLYLVTQTSVSANGPCPVEIFSLDGKAVSVTCDRIYHPAQVIPVDSTYSIARINPNDGKTQDSIEFVAPSGQTVVYMSNDDIFVSYSFQSNIIEFFAGFFEQNSDLVPQMIVTKLISLKDLDISQAAKMTELNVIWQNFLSSLNDDERLRLENNLQNKIKAYEEEHLRQLDQTGISRISLKPMEFSASGLVPGNLLNQFSLDYYKDHLRVATTIQSSWWLPGIRSSQTSVNDLYVLDKNLNQVGSVTDLGKGERIYSVRFMDDLAYMVTFKQTDPFFVFDLKSPRSPQKVGELKIPGYSSYLHQLKPGLILGVGKDDNQVKLSLFDVGNLTDPQEVDKYFLTEYYSEILNTHHAFLLDEANQLFFIPGSQGGYVFSYKNNKLELEKAIADIRAKRALYLDNYLYILGEEKLVVYDINGWEEVNRLTF